MVGVIAIETERMEIHILSDVFVFITIVVSETLYYFISILFFDLM